MTTGGKFFKRTMNSVPLAHKVVLVRTDYNVPLTAKGKISDDLRIRASIPTLHYLLKQGCKVVIISHLGRPKGPDPKLSLEPVAARLAELLGQPVRFVDQTVGDKVKMAIKRAPYGTVTVLENLRFDAREEANDYDFAKQLAHDTGARYFVQDGFGVVHRAHASTDAITQFIPGVAGLLLEREYTTITGAMEQPSRPLMAVMGGAKVSDKIAVIKAFVDKADKILIGGAMANTFLAYKGYAMGVSKVEPDQTAVLDEIYRAAEQKVGADHVDKFLRLPSDVAVAKAIDAGETRRVVSVDKVAPDDIALDIGDETIETYAREVANAKTVIWNGTLGYAELPEFSHGSARMCLELATHPGITTIIGGGDTADFVLGWDSKKGGSFSHVSTGGGASLDLMAGKVLPGVASLLDA